MKLYFFYIFILEEAASNKSTEFKILNIKQNYKI